MKKVLLFFYHTVSQNVKNLWEKIKAETTYRIIPLVTYEVVVYLMLSTK